MGEGQAVPGIRIWDQETSCREVSLLQLSGLCRVRHQLRLRAAERLALKPSREITGDKKTKGSSVTGQETNTEQNRDKGQTTSLKTNQFVCLFVC